jgi:cystathionine beta-lyase/cystathionine gamma-synthase
MQAAYPPYRVALFRTNSNAQVEAQQAIAQAQQAWTKLAQQYGEKPPVPYDRDSAFATSLGEVSKVYETAALQVMANQLTAAHETLEKVRDIMAEIRRRNQVVVFSDHMNAYHTEMENVLISGPTVLTQPDGKQEFIAMVGVLNYLAKRLSSQAPGSYAKNEEFIDSVKAVAKSVSDLQTAAFSQDAAAIKAAMAKVKAPYSKFFLKFG